jgi:hypothetical protein
MNDSQTVKGLLLTELARAEFVVADANSGNKKAHGPTVDYFKGQADLIRRVLHFAGEEVTQQNRADILEWYVAARSDGWECESFVPDGDHWEHAILMKENWMAEVDMVRGRCILWHHSSEVQLKAPYSWPPSS